MDREPLFAVLLLIIAGPLFWVGRFAFSFVRPRAIRERASANELLRWATQRLVAPLVPAALAASCLVGWALQEPDDAEWPGSIGLVFAGIVALVWLRAVTRLIRSVLATPRGLAFTHGLVSPRIVIAPAVALLDPSAIHAIRLHEAAHAHAHDPLRILLARFVADLGWPFPGARNDLRFFLGALEIARDDAARSDGADGCALAEGIIACARMSGDATGAVASIAGDQAALFAERVRRLLSPRIVEPRRAAKSVGLPLVIAALAVAFAVAGVRYGEAIVGAILELA